MGQEMRGFGAKIYRNENSGTLRLRCGMPLKNIAPHKF